MDQGDAEGSGDDIIHFISKKMTLQHRKEAQHQDQGGQRDVWQTDADVAESDNPVKQDKPKGSGSASDASGGNPRSPCPEFGVQAVDAILAEVYGVQSTSQPNELASWRSAPLGYAAVIPRVPQEARRTRRQGRLVVEQICVVLGEGPLCIKNMTARAAAMPAFFVDLYRIVITAMITGAVR